MPSDFNFALLKNSLQSGESSSREDMVRSTAEQLNKDIDAHKPVATDTSAPVESEQDVIDESDDDETVIIEDDEDDTSDNDISDGDLDENDEDASDDNDESSNNDIIVDNIDSNKYDIGAYNPDDDDDIVSVDPDDDEDEDESVVESDFSDRDADVEDDEDASDEEDTSSEDAKDISIEKSKKEVAKSSKSVKTSAKSTPVKKTKTSSENLKVSELRNFPTELAMYIKGQFGGKAENMGEAVAAYVYLKEGCPNEIPVSDRIRDLVDNYTGDQISNSDLQHKLLEVNKELRENIRVLERLFKDQFTKKLTAIEIAVLTALIENNKLMPDDVEFDSSDLGSMMNRLDEATARRINYERFRADRTKR